MLERYDLVPQGISAEMIAEKWGITREENDAFSLESHRRAARATEEGRFEHEIVPVPVMTEAGAETMTRDEGIRTDSSAEKLAQLKPVFKPDGVITAGNSSQISDGAAGDVDHERGAAVHSGSDRVRASTRSRSRASTR